MREVSEHRYPGNERLEDMVTRFHEEYGLAWSRDQRHLYWCPSRVGEGVVVAVDEGTTAYSPVCLVMATWSPDGAHVAGVAGSRLEVCDFDEDARSLDCR
jgi:hypothetical protein